LRSAIVEQGVKLTQWCTARTCTGVLVRGRSVIMSTSHARASRDCGSRGVTAAAARNLRPASLLADRRVRSDPSPAPRCRQGDRAAPTASVACLARSQHRSGRPCRVALSTDRHARSTDLVRIIH